MKVKLQNTYELQTGDGLSVDQINLLQSCEGREVEILATATDGYFDVRLPIDEVIDALSGYHLAGLENVRGIDFFE